MNRSGAALAVAATYASAVGLLFLADMILAAHVPPAVFGEYTLTRNALPLVLTTALFGVDQALIRSLAAAPVSGLLKSVMGHRLLRGAALGTLGACALILLGAHWMSGLVLIVCSVSVCTSELISAAFRGHGSYILSSALQQGYRMVLAFLLIGGVWFAQLDDYSFVAFSLMFACLGVGILATLVARPFWREPTARDERQGLNRLGVGFGISMLSFAALDWMDQALVTLLSRDLASTGAYNLHKLWGVYPLLSMASIGGFLLMPELVRNRHALTGTRLRKIVKIAAAVSMLLALLVYVVSLWLIPRFMQVTIEPFLLAIFVVIGAVRLFYLVPSAVLGALGTDMLIRRSSVAGLTSIPLMALVAVALASALDPRAAVAVALGVATVARAAIAMWAASKAVICPAT